ncbi:hypothetical protein [Mucilaginibacter sp. AK015]|uniref:hypothetical protein n=1 Tax=Mucilaginibacter sp. AK015 TaxID=2723072 RepID=UPI00161CA2ED|nr:hypothetical protein [Mucilaginibacter sp. AK015]MBB5395066.1 hypothetical protein [Mucilaginibacter sp. AK015]
MRPLIPSRTSILQRLRSFRRSKDNNKSVEPAEAEKTEDALHEELRQKLNNIMAIGGSENELIENVQAHILGSGEYYQSIGKMHGRIGARDFQMLKTARTYANLITERVVSSLKGRIAALNLLISDKGTELQKLREQEAGCLEKLSELTDLRHHDHKQFNRFNARVYLTAALLMILADIAVSVNLVAFFGIGHQAPDASFKQKLGDPELMLFSFGIALCTVFVKIFYDEYINSKLGHMQQHVREMAAEKANIGLLVAELALKFLVKACILIALLWLLYNLAEYRTYFTLYSSLKTKVAKMALDPRTRDVADVLLKSFVGITVIVPVISGIALSVALKIIANRRALINSEKAAAAASNNCLLTQEMLQEKTYLLKKLEQYLEEWENKKEKIDLQSAYFVQVYEQGFRISYRAHHGHDLYKLIEEYRNEVVNQTFNRRLNSN